MAVKRSARRGCRHGAAIAVALFAASGAAASDEEHLAPPTDPAMVLGFAHGRPGSIEEYVPRGETVQFWSRMITIQRIGFRPGLTPAGFAESVGAGWARACPGATVGSATRSTIDGHDVADIRMDCPRNPATRLPETMYGRTILGDEVLHMVQVAFRRRPSDADEAYARRTIAAATLCARADVTPRCNAVTR